MAVRTAALSCVEVAAHPGNALEAAATARSTSSTDERAYSAIASPVAGARSSAYPPLTGLTHSPPMKFS